MTMRVPPITIIAFRRPDLTRRVLEAVAEVRPQKLFVFTDGPRPDHPEDESACAETDNDEDHEANPASAVLHAPPP